MKLSICCERSTPTKYPPDNGADYPKSAVGQRLQQIGVMIKANIGVEVLFLDCGGWDNHVNEGGAQGQLANLLKDLGQSLAAFHQDMGDRMADIVVVTMSEFGRTAKENGNRGTDHGHANCMFVMGGDVQGGRVYGKWPGLNDHQLNEGRDLALTTDFRSVVGEILTKHLGVKDLAPVFPGFENNPTEVYGIGAGVRRLDAARALALCYDLAFTTVKAAASRRTPNYNSRIQILR